jgi:hypothetical protein
VVRLFSWLVSASFFDRPGFFLGGSAFSLWLALAFLLSCLRCSSAMPHRLSCLAVLGLVDFSVWVGTTANETG